MTEQLERRRSVWPAAGLTSSPKPSPHRDCAPDDADSRELRRELLADASDQASLLLRRTTELSDEITQKSREEAYRIERAARDQAERIIANAKEERQRLLSVARERASRIESELSRSLADLQAQDAARCVEFNDELTGQRAINLRELLEFLNRADTEVSRLRSLAIAELARAGAGPRVDRDLRDRLGRAEREPRLDSNQEPAAS